MPDSEDRFGRIWRDLNQAEIQHLSYEQLEAYVDARLDPTGVELLQAHCDLCEQCAAEVADLRQFASALQERHTAPVLAPQRGPVRWWEWLAVPRHAWMLAGAAALLIMVISVVPRASQPVSTPVASGPATQPSSGATETAPRLPVESVLEPPPIVVGLKGSGGGRSMYHVLSPAEALKYQLELENAPIDPEARAAVAIKYGLYGEAEKEYQKLIDAGGEKAARGQLLKDLLEHLRHP